MSVTRFLFRLLHMRVEFLNYLGSKRIDFTKIHENKNLNFFEGVACVRAELKSSLVPNLKITQKQQIDRLIRFSFKYGRSLNF